MENHSLTEQARGPPSFSRPDSTSTTADGISQTTNGRDSDRVELQPLKKQAYHSVYQEQSTRLFGLGYWVSEIVSFWISVLSLVAIIIVAQYCHGQPLPDWPGFLTLNFIISIFASIFKAALLLPVAEALSELKWIWFSNPNKLSDMDEFDLASRGPRGALRLLLTPLRNRLATIGALITVISLGIDSVTQLSIQTYDCLWVTPGLASISRTNYYDAIGPNLGSGHYEIDRAMSSAIYQGILNPEDDLSGHRIFECAQGNCTFLNDQTFYRTLAICSLVEDISQDIIEVNPMELVLPSGLNVTYRGLLLSTAEVSRVQYAEDSPLFEFEILSFKQHSAFRASIYPCIQTFQTPKVSRSYLEEQFVSLEPLVRVNAGRPYYSLAGDSPPFAGVECSSSTSEDKFRKQPVLELEGGEKIANLDFSRGSEYFNGSFVANRTLWYDPACTYSVGALTVNALVSYLERMFGTIESPNSVGGAWSPYGDIHLMYLYQDGNISLSSATSYMEGIARSMTMEMRKNGNTTNSQPLLGEMLADKTCVQFDWRFLFLDVALLVVAAFFISATVWNSQQQTNNGPPRAKRGPWKSSTLPLLWCGLDDETKQRFEPMTYVPNDMKMTSQLLKVRLVRRDQSLREVRLPAAGSTAACISPDTMDGATNDNEISGLMHNQAPKSTGGWVLSVEENAQAAKPHILRRIGYSLADYIPI